jgi:hypothetical protein
MPEPKAQLVDPQGPIDVPGLSVTGVTTATGGFVGQVQGTATGLASTTANLSVGIVTATKFVGNTPGNVSGLADGTNINVGIITSTSFTGDLVGNAAGLSTTTANIKAGILSATSFAGNFTGVASGITGTPNIVVGIMTGTLKGDGSGLTGIAATNWISNNVTANSGTTTVNLSLGNVVKFTQTSNTTVSFANTGTSNIVSFIRPAADYTITWPSAIKWDGGSAPTLDTNGANVGDVNVITLLTRDEGVTWYGWQTIAQDSTTNYELWGWGKNNEHGNLGQNSKVDYSSPVQVPGRWNSFGNGVGGGPMVLKDDGTLWAWGRNTYGNLGQNQAEAQLNSGSSPVQIPGTTWAAAGCGAQFNMATKTDGTLYAWGYNQSGMLGLNNRTYYSSPVQIPGTTWGTTREKIAGSDTVAGAIKTDGTLWHWGNITWAAGNNTQGVSYSSPAQIPGTTWDKLSYSGGGYLSAIKTDSTLWVWGYNGPGRLGQNSRVSYSSPVQIPGTWKQSSTSNGETGMINTDGELWMLGQNRYGLLGQNEGGNPATEYSSPVQVPGTTWDTIIMRSYHVLATKTDGTMWAWGSNNRGALGQNQTGHPTSFSSPVQIPGTNWHDITITNESGNMALKDV